MAVRDAHLLDKYEPRRDKANLVHVLSTPKPGDETLERFRCTRSTDHASVVGDSTDPELAAVEAWVGLPLERELRRRILAARAAANEQVGHRDAHCVAQHRRISEPTRTSTLETSTPSSGERTETYLLAPLACAPQAPPAL